MARLDARVKTELPASVIYGLRAQSFEESVTLKEISLGGALVHGLQENRCDGGSLRIRTELPRHGEVELQGQVVREKAGLAAMRFFAADEPSVSALWGHIKEKLKPAGLCPYCAQLLEGANGLCRHCRLCLDFEDRFYLERHLRNTFAARIGSLISGLDSSQLQNLVGLIEQEVARAQLPDPQVEPVGQSPAMLRVQSLVARFAPTDANVLILGEKGTEKEWVARSLHHKSERRLKPFVPIKVNSIPVALMDPELFGFSQGAFRQANRAQKGLLEAADGGSVFIDDIGCLPPSLQAKLLRFLKDGVIERLGARGGKRVDVRILAGAGEEFVPSEEKGRFVEDFLAQMAPEALRLPALRDRGEDCVLLAGHFLKEFGREKNKAPEGFSDDALEMIRNDSWPGNVSQLECSVKQGVAAARGRFVKKTDMASQEAGNQADKQSLKAAVSISEKEAVARALEENRYNISRAAKALKISRPSLYSLMKKYHIQKPEA